MFLTLIMVMISWMYVNVQIHQTLFFKHVPVFLSFCLFDCCCCCLYINYPSIKVFYKSEQMELW